jgi:ABC-type glutathione transport system ATPase component
LYIAGEYDRIIMLLKVFISINNHDTRRKMMNAILEVRDVRKTFILSRKQQKINRTTEKIKVAVDGLSLDAYDGEIYGLLGSNGQVKPPPYG